MSSSREAEVLERQRQMADRLLLKRPSSLSSSSSRPARTTTAATTKTSAAAAAAAVAIVGGKNVPSSSSSDCRDAVVVAGRRGPPHRDDGCDDGRPPTRAVGGTRKRPPPPPPRLSAADAALAPRRSRVVAEGPVTMMRRDAPLVIDLTLGPSGSQRKRPTTTVRDEAGAAAAALAAARAAYAGTRALAVATGPEDASGSRQKRPTMMRAATAAAASAAAAAETRIAPKKGGAATATTSGSLSSILLSNAGTARFLQPDAPRLLRHYEKIVPDDYWKNMTSWDFLGDLNGRMTTSRGAGGDGVGGGGGGGGGGGECKGGGCKDDEDDGAQEKPPRTTSLMSSSLPDSFGSYREYCALWAPLCLEEARAQLLAEVAGDVPHWRGAGRYDGGPVRVMLEPMRKDVHSSSEFIGVRVKSVLTASSDYKDRSFISNDLVLLVREESYIWEAYGGTLMRRKSQQQQQGPGQSRQPNRFGIVGYIEYTRRSIEGVTVQVSKEFWSDVGTSEMVLLKLGCNITSLREFTALCRMDSIPLLDYILGSKMSSRTGAAGPTTRIKGEESYAAAIDPSPSDEKRAKRDVLSMMGGPSALGKGFADYASRKFNLSQLGAISASAQEYGEGGFTLIKGPPGTGKVRQM